MMPNPIYRTFRVLGALSVFVLLACFAQAQSNAPTQPPAPGQSPNAPAQRITKEQLQTGRPETPIRAATPQTTAPLNRTAEIIQPDGSKLKVEPADWNAYQSKPKVNTQDQKAAMAKSNGKVDQAAVAKFESDFKQWITANPNFKNVLTPFEKDMVAKGQIRAIYLHNMDAQRANTNQTTR
jgi:hypothetical protein